MRFKNPMNREALALLSKDELIDLVLSLAARLDQLERRLGLNSTNSGKPPSSDGLSKPPAGKQKRRRTGSLREKSGRKPGGQKGHEGETLRQVAEPDAITDHDPETCPNCGSGLTPEMSTGHGARQVFDLPEPRPLVVMEHRAHRCRCGRCGRQTRAAFPAGVTGPVRYGARIGAMVVYLSHYQLLPEDRLAELMADLFGHPLSRGPAPARPRTGRGPGQAPWTQAAPYRPQPSPTSSGAQGRRATLPRQPRRALHQQSGRAGRAHGEAQAENLRRLPIRTRGERLRDHPRLHLDRQKTGLEHHSRAHGKSRNPDRSSPRRLIGPDLPGQLPFNLTERV